MKDVKIVVGANWGDEGKGLATEFLSTNSGRVLNILSNGGPQRGHTITYNFGLNEKSHIFSHFGSGTLVGADSCFDEHFMVNPMLFVREYKELDAIGKKPNKVWIHSNCRVITPYDMIINQIVEESRGKNRHGSCGCGIWETDQRYRYDKIPHLTYGAMRFLSETGLLRYLKKIVEEYLPKRLKHYGIEFNKIPEVYKELINDEKLTLRYIEDFKFMCNKTIPFQNYGPVISYYDTIVFENAQGLELDENNKASFPHVTASSTTSTVPYLTAREWGNVNIEIVYVTRTYFTRHGEGPFPTECKKEDININIVDKTNEPNPFQGTIRYGYFNVDTFINRIKQDSVSKEAKISLFISHMNYTKGKLKTGPNDLTTIRELIDKGDFINTIYGSYGKNSSNTFIIL